MQYELALFRKSAQFRWASSSIYHGHKSWPAALAGCTLGFGAAKMAELREGRVLAWLGLNLQYGRGRRYDERRKVSAAPPPQPASERRGAGRRGVVFSS